MKKGQMETMGLVIVVILLVFIAIFALSFIIKPGQEDEDILKVKASALRSSVLKTTLCVNTNVEKELENCLFDVNVCETPCESLGGKIESIIKSSLELNEGYVFSIESLNINLNTCVGRDRITAIQQKIGEDESVEVALCRR